MGALYQIAFPNGKRYIGMTVADPRKRCYEHRYQARLGVMQLPVYRAMRKFGVDNSKFEILAVASDRKYLEELERKAIQVFGTRAPHGYNATDGGDGAPVGNQYQLGRKRTPESRAKMSASAKSRPPISAETRVKFSALKKGNQHNRGKTLPVTHAWSIAVGNRCKGKGASSGRVGVSFHKKQGNWRAHITLNTKFIHLGSFDCLIDAVAARMAGERKYFGTVA